MCLQGDATNKIHFLLQFSTVITRCPISSLNPQLSCASIRPVPIAVPSSLYAYHAIQDISTLSLLSISDLIMLLSVFTLFLRLTR